MTRHLYCCYGSIYKYLNIINKLAPHVITSLLLAGLLCGCHAEDPPIGQFDHGGTVDSWRPPDQPPTCEGAPKLAAPKLDAYPNPTAHPVQPFRGVAPGAATITARVGSVTFKPVSVGSDGHFCIEAQLIPDAVNTVTFTPWDANTCPGIDTTITLTHRTTPGVDAGITTLQNVAKSQPVSAAEAPDSGDLSYIVDGDAKSTATFSFWDWDWGGACDKYVWVRVDLGKVYNVTKVKILWPPQVGSDYARCYGVLLSSSTAPVDPDPQQIQDWETVKEESNGLPQDQVILTAPTAARWAALLMYENASSGLTETFVLGDLEVWGQDPNAVPPPPPDKCE